MRETQNLIDSLIQSGSMPKPVRPFALFTGWVVALAGYILLIFVTGALTLRPDLADAMQRPLFTAEILSLAALVLVCVYAATLLAYPDQCQKRATLYAPVGVFIFFALVLVAEVVVGAPVFTAAHPGLSCLLCISALSLLPAILLFYRMLRMATTSPDRAGMVCALCAFAVGALILRLSEPTDMILHVVLWHYLPMLVIAGVGFWVGPRFLKW